MFEFTIISKLCDYSECTEEEVVKYYPVPKE